MKKFIYAFTEEDRKELISKDFQELFECNLGGKKGYVFQYKPQICATFSQEDRSKFLITNVAYF